MELRQLSYFAEAVRVGSFLRAAESLGVAQPSLWRQVKALEAELGVALFERSGRGVRVSSAGSHLLPRVTELLNSAEAVRALSGELARGRAGLVTITCAHPHVPRFLAPLIGSFHARHPGIRVALNEATDLPALEGAISGTADFVTGLPRTYPGLAHQRLGEVRLVVVTPDDHPWRQLAEVTVSQLCKVPVLIGAPGSLSRRLLEPAVMESGFALDIALESGNATTLVALARAGLDVAVIADDNFGSEVTWPTLVDDLYPVSTEVWIYWARDRALSPPVRLFAEHLSEAGIL